MAENEIELAGWLVQHTAGLLDKIPVASAMCAVSAYPMLLADALRQSVRICPWGHRLMEGCVKYCDLRIRHATHKF